MVTLSSDVSPQRHYRCFGKFFDAKARECMICDDRVECSKEMKGAPMTEQPPQPAKQPPAESPPQQPAEPITQTGSDAQPPAAQPPETLTASGRKPVEASAFEPLQIRANTAGAFAIQRLREDWWKPKDLAEAVKQAAGGKGTKAYDMINRLKKNDLLEVRGEGRDKEYHLKQS